MKNSFIRNLRSEGLKIRHTACLWLTLGAALFLPAINTLICIERPEAMIEKFRSDPWVQFIRFNWKNLATIIFPFYVILLNALILQIEFRNNTWKQVYTLPRSYADIYFSKVIIILAIELLALFLFDFGLFSSAIIIGHVRRGFGLDAGSFPWRLMLTLTFRIFLGMLPVSAIQYWLSTRFRNFVVSAGVGLGLWFAGVGLAEWDKMLYYPYLYSIWFFFNDFSKHPEQLPILVACSWILFFLSLALGYSNVRSLRQRL